MPRVARVPEGTADCPEVFKVLKGILPREQELITCLRDIHQNHAWAAFFNLINSLYDRNASIFLRC